MKQHVRIAFVCACLASVLPARAYADSMLTPFLGVNFGGATGEQFSDATSGNRRFDVGASLTRMSGGIFGLEADLGYTSQFYSPAASYDATRVVTAMGNLVIGVPVGGQAGLGVRPYVLAGVGLIRRTASGLAGTPDVSENDLGYDLGGGVMIFFADHVGVRGDLRYFRNFQASLAPPDITKGTFNFSRAAAGLVLRF